MWYWSIPHVLQITYVFSQFFTEKHHDVFPKHDVLTNTTCFAKTYGIGEYHMFDEKSCFTMGYIVKSHKLYRNADPIQFKKLDWKIYNSSLE